MYKYEICFKSGEKFEFESNEDKNEIIFHVKNGMVRGGIITSINHLEISIRCDDVSYIREVK